MSIYFVRHIKTNFNKFGLISGRIEADVLPGQKLLETSEFPEKFDLVLCSTLERCIKTLELLPEGMCREIIYTDDLLERDVGILEGLKRDYALQEYPDLFCNRKIDVNAVVPHGESIAQVVDRTKEIVDKLKACEADENILVCSHNQTLKIIFATLMDIEISNDYWQKINFKNGEVISAESLIHKC